MDPLRVFTEPDSPNEHSSVLMPLLTFRAIRQAALLDLLDPNFQCARYRISSLPDLAVHLSLPDRPRARSRGSPGADPGV